MGYHFQGTGRAPGITGRAMKKDTAKEFVEEEVVVDGVTAVRRRRVNVTPERQAPFLHVPMECVKILSTSSLPSAGWSLGLWIIWHYVVSSGGAAAVTTVFASRAGVPKRAARRHAVAALEATGLFEVTRKGRDAVRISPGPKLKAALKRK